jgi:endonuclease/exonuclease/phosphatase family metal-dependent hydrolase
MLATVLFAGLLGAFHYWADEYAVPTLFLFGPRWMAIIPLVVLISLAIYSRSPVAMTMTVAIGLIVIGPIMGGQLGLKRFVGSERPALQQLRVVTWNMGGAHGKTAVRRLIDDVNPTILVCEEASWTSADVSSDWKVMGNGGYRVATRLPIRAKGFLDLGPIGAPGGAERYVVETPDGEVQLVNVHLPTPRPGIEAAIASRGWELAELRRIIEVRAEASRVARRWVEERGGIRIVAGDFNMPVESRIYRRTWSDLGNAFSDAGLGWGTTKQTSWFGTRIDHVLYSAPWRCRKAWVGPAMGSDHRPLIADLEWVDGAN